MTIVLPVTSAGAVFRAIRKKGKFHGRMPPITPIGWRNRKMVSPGRSLSQDLAFDAPRPFGHVVDVVGGEVDFDAREPEGLALLLGDDAGDRVRLAAYPLGYLPDVRRARLGREFAQAG